jgi:hypothetical protein
VREHTCHPAYAGSYSIKSVLPALVPDMTYDGMEVSNGQDAGLAWESLVRGGIARDERERIREALLDYCGQDTLALLRLHEVLRLHLWLPFSSDSQPSEARHFAVKDESPSQRRLWREPHLIL